MARKHACRVCGCTEDRACVVVSPNGLNAHPCSWAKTEPGSPPLCTACAGTDADMAEALKRGTKLLATLVSAHIRSAIDIGEAALSRRASRRRREAKEARANG